jgi:hypothetical protein
MFAATVPLGLLLLGVLGLWAKRRLTRTDPGFLLLFGAFLLVLVVFALPGTPVYDGVRLFLVVFPVWAVFVGAGSQWLTDHHGWRSVPRRWRLLALGIFLAVQGVGIVIYRQCPLSHYSLIVGGLPGAERLGLEVTYWGDAVGEPLLAEAARLAPGEKVLFGPHLSSHQASAVWLASPALIEADVQLIGWDPNWVTRPAGCRYGIFYRRRADLGSIPPEMIGSRVIREHRNQGVWVARLVEFGAGD